MQRPVPFLRFNLARVKEKIKATEHPHGRWLGLVGLGPAGAGRDEAG